MKYLVFVSSNGCSSTLAPLVKTLPSTYKIFEVSYSAASWTQLNRADVVFYESPGDQAPVRFPTLLPGVLVLVTGTPIPCADVLDASLGVIVYGDRPLALKPRHSLPVVGVSEGMTSAEIAGIVLGLIEHASNRRAEIGTLQLARRAGAAMWGWAPQSLFERLSAIILTGSTRFPG